MGSRPSRSSQPSTTTTTRRPESHLHGRCASFPRWRTTRAPAPARTPRIGAVRSSREARRSRKPTKFFRTSAPEATATIAAATRREKRRAWDPHYLPMAGALTVNNSEAYDAACVAGLGLIQAPAVGMQHLIEQGLLVEVLPRRAPRPTSSASQDLAKLPPLALGRSALARLRRLGSTLFLEPLAACDAVCGLHVQLASEARRAALRRQCLYHDLQPLVADLNVEQLADLRFARGLYPLAVDAYAAKIDRLAGQRARLEKARCPQPLVETNSIGIGTHHAMLRDFGCWCEPHGRSWPITLALQAQLPIVPCGIAATLRRSTA